MIASSPSPHRLSFSLKNLPAFDLQTGHCHGANDTPSFQRESVGSIRIEIEDESNEDEEVPNQKRRRRRRRNDSDAGKPTMLSAPAHVHGNEWRDMLSLVDILHQPSNLKMRPVNHEMEGGRSRTNTRVKSWIEDNINKRECTTFIPSQKYVNRCGCGLGMSDHSSTAIDMGRSASTVTPTADDHLRVEPTDELMESPNSSMVGPPTHKQRWAIRKHTLQLPTDAYGTLQLEGGGHNSEAKFVRLSFDTPPDVLISLLLRVWRLQPPKMIITIHGGLTDFDLQTKLARAIRRGIMKSAQSTDVWVITSGMHQGVVKHVCESMAGELDQNLKASRKSKAVLTSIGIAPWGMLKKRNRLIGENANIRYTMTPMSGKLGDLDDSHSNFLLADNGTVGRYGAEIVLRRRLESLLATGTAPLVAMVVEGGAFSVKLMHDYLTTSPSIPVVVCDGSGRASDLVSFASQYLEEEDTIPESVRVQILNLARNVFDIDEEQSKRILRLILTIYRMGEAIQDVDHAIFSAMLKGHNLTSLEQLSLALAWDRVDIARAEIFNENTEWTQADLQEAFMEALANDRVQFVHLLLEKGVDMQNFLTYERLERLYNTDLGPHHALRSITGCRKLNLPMIGEVIEKLIGSNYRSNYTSNEFLSRYNLYLSRQQKAAKKPMFNGLPAINGNLEGVQKKTSVVTALGGLFVNNEETADVDNSILTEARHRYPMSPLLLLPTGLINLTRNLFTFERPFHELLLWAVLTKRHSMALMMWRHGDEGLAKALIASRLNWSLAHKAAEDYLEMQLCEHLRENADVFRELATELLEACYEVDDQLCQNLLTYELANWGGLTNLTLAAINAHKMFMKHPCPQLILTELWHGGMQVMSQSNWLIVGALCFPPFIFMLEFKSREEIREGPQTAAEHDAVDYSSDSSMSSDSSVSDSDSDSEADRKEQTRRPSRASSMGVFINNVARRSFRKEKKEEKEHQAIHHLASHVLPGIFTTASASTGLQSPATSHPRSTSVSSRARTQTVQKSHHGHKHKKRSYSRNARKPSRTSQVSLGRKDDIYASYTPDHTADDDVEEKTPINWMEKLIEFYTAPITTYWLWALSFLFFQILLANVLLLRTTNEVKWTEWYLLLYIIAFGSDLMRKFIYYERRPLSYKFRRFFIAFRNGTSAIAVVTFVIAFIVRLMPDPDTIQVGRVLIIMNSVLWSFKLIDLLSVHRKLGPYITTASEMVPRTVAILTMLFVVLLSFGLVRQAITFPNEDWDWILIRNIFLKPYYMLYGEVYADKIDTCGDGIWEEHIKQGVPISMMNVSDPSGTCVPGHWVAPLYMVVFMLIANVLLMNTMVACCTYVYEKRVESVQIIWLFERYRQVMEYNSKPWLPPPFTLISHAILLFKYFRARGTDNARRKLMDSALKVFLTEDKMRALHRFERECLEDSERAKEWRKQNSSDQQITRTAQKSEDILNKLSTMSSFETTMRDVIRDVEDRIQTLEKKRREEMEDIRRMGDQLDKLISVMSSTTTPVPTPSASSLFAPQHRIPDVFVYEPDQGREGRPVRRSSEDSEIDGDGDTSRRPSVSAAPRHRSHNEYTTIADQIQRPSSRSATRTAMPRRRRFVSNEVNSILLSVSEEGDEPLNVDFNQTDDEQ